MPGAWRARGAGLAEGDGGASVGCGRRCHLVAMGRARWTPRGARPRHVSVEGGGAWLGATHCDCASRFGRAVASGGRPVRLRRGHRFLDSTCCRHTGRGGLAVCSGGSSGLGDPRDVVCAASAMEKRPAPSVAATSALRTHHARLRMHASSPPRRQPQERSERACTQGNWRPSVAFGGVNMRLGSRCMMCLNCLDVRAIRCWECVCVCGGGLQAHVYDMPGDKWDRTRCSHRTGNPQSVGRPAWPHSTQIRPPCYRRVAMRRSDATPECSEDAQAVLV